MEENRTGGDFSEPLAGKADGEKPPATVAELRERFGGLILRLARRMTGNDAEAEDAVQDAYLHLHKMLPRYDAVRAFRPWLTAVVARLFVDRLRAAKADARRRRVVHDEWTARKAQAQTDPAAAAAERETLRRLRRAMDALAPEDRALLVLCLEREEPLATAAEALGLSRDAARNRLFRLRRRLREELNPGNFADTERKRP